MLSTVGAGDSMLAGILFMLANGEALHTALEYGVACGTAETTKHGTGLCERNLVDELFQKIGLTRFIENRMTEGVKCYKE